MNAKNKQFTPRYALQVVPMVMPGYDDSKLRGATQTEIPRAGGAEFVHQWKQILWFVKVNLRDASVEA